MSILIKGMEMPTTCGNCPVHKLWAEDDEAQCMIKRELWTKCSKRNPDCPLIEIPDGHGRLIDADALMNDGWTLHKRVMRMGGYAIHEMPLDNPNVSIVIPADKDGET